MSKIAAAMAWIGNRAKEPSTHAALAALAAVLIPVLPPNVGLIAVGVFGLLGITLKEGK